MLIVVDLAGNFLIHRFKMKVMHVTTGNRFCLPDFKKYGILSLILRQRGEL